MDKIIDRTIKQYITSVSKEQPGLIAAYLFGSYARNNQRVESDIDILNLFFGIKIAKHQFR